MTSIIKSIASLLAATPPNGEQKKSDEPSTAATDQAAARLLKLDKEANTGDPKAQCKLGVRLLSEVPPNYSEAHYLFTLAALRRLPVAEYNLGAMFANGMGVKKDPETAVEWFKRAAEGGNARAQYNLGCALQRGWGIDKDVAAAKVWYAHARDQGHEKAALALKELDAVDPSSS